MLRAVLGEKTIPRSCPPPGPPPPPFLDRKCTRYVLNIKCVRNENGRIMNFIKKIFGFGGGVSNRKKRSSYKNNPCNDVQLYISGLHNTTKADIY
jgi:hypothetical protein